MSSMSMPTIVVSPYNVINFLEGGGHFWVYMQYVLALRALGYDVYWLEMFRPSGDERHDSAILFAFLERMQRYSLGDKLLVYMQPGPQQTSGRSIDYLCRSNEEAESIMQQADMLLNFHYAIDPQLLARFKRTALVDIDPGLLQFWISRGQLHVHPHHCY